MLKEVKYKALTEHRDINIECACTVITDAKKNHFKLAHSKLDRGLHYVTSQRGNMTLSRSKMAMFEMEGSLHDARGNVYVEMGNFERAIASYEKSLEIGTKK